MESALSEGANFAITLSIQSRLDQVRLVRAALFGVLDHLGVVESYIYSLQLAVTEIVNNCFEHGYEGAEDRHIEVRIQVCDADVQIDVIDDAPPFPQDQRYRLLDEPLPIEDPDEEWTIRGHGLQIVRQTVDSVEHTTRNRQNCITLRKHVGLQEN